jgi:lysophospholipase L1-like esterase
LAKYRTPEEKMKYRKQQKRRKMLMYSCIAVFVLVCSFTIIKVVEMLAGSAPQVSSIFGKQPIQTANTDVTKQASKWSTFEGEVEKTINTGDFIPDISMVQVMENGKVDVSYFDDAIFLGDSLADGFKVYSRSLDLSNSSARYLTQKSTSPRTFLQPGVHVDAGAGPVDVWATIGMVQPGKMYITLGTNALMAMSPEDFVASYYQLIDKIRATSPDTQIYVTTVTPVAAWKSQKEPRLSFDRIYRSNQLIAKMCVEKNLALINLYDVLKSSSGYLREEIAAGDGIHLSPSGYREWLEYLTTHAVYNPNNKYV